MTVRTRHPRKKSAIAQGTAIVGRNGLPIDTVVVFDSSVPILTGTTTTVSYTSPTVTVNAAIDLTLLTTHEFRDTQLLAFTDSSGSRFFIDRPSINPTAKTFDIYSNITSDSFGAIDLSSAPASINTAAGWQFHELKWTNRLATSNATIIESVEFGGVDMDLKLNGKGPNGDTVRITDSDGDELEINPDGSINVNGSLDVEIDAKDGDNIAISAHPNQIFDEFTDTITTAAFEAIFSHTSVDSNTKIVAVECTASTSATFQLKIDGTLIRTIRTSPTERTKTVVFREHRSLTSGQILTVEAKVDRFFSYSSPYSTFCSLEGYIA